MHVGRPAAVLDRLHDELDRVLGVDVHALTDDELLDAAADVYRCEARVAALKARLVGAVDARQAHVAVGAQSAVQWVKHRCRVPGGAARADVLLGRSLRHLPETAARLADGDLGAAQATRIARHHRNPRTETAVERDEAVLAEQATRLLWRHFTTLMAFWEQRVDPDGTDLDAEARKARRRLHLSRTFEGEWALDGLLDPVNGSILDGALQRVEQELF